MPPSASTTPGTASAGYRLSGADMSPFVGQRVQIVGTFAPAPATSSPSGVSGATGTSGTTAIPEFRVISVRPIGGCQQ
jgi:hypothetical protein